MKRVAADGATHWESTALPLLERLVAKEQALRDRGLLELGAGQNGAEWLELAMTDGELYETLHQLRDLDCIGFKVERAGGPSAMFLDLCLTGRGLQVLGEWPRFEAWTSPAPLAAFADQLAEVRLAGGSNAPCASGCVLALAGAGRDQGCGDRGREPTGPKRPRSRVS
jgi:hypothetical protein